jgi:hypothetical protein
MVQLTTCFLVELPFLRPPIVSSKCLVLETCSAQGVHVLRSMVASGATLLTLLFTLQGLTAHCPVRCCLDSQNRAVPSSDDCSREWLTYCTIFGATHLHLMTLNCTHICREHFLLQNTRLYERSTHLAMRIGDSVLITAPCL